MGQIVELEDLFPPIWLVVWNMAFIFHIFGITIPTDFHIFRGVEATNQLFSRSMTISMVMAMILILFISQERNA